MKKKTWTLLALAIAGTFALAIPGGAQTAAANPDVDPAATGALDKMGA